MVDDPKDTPGIAVRRTSHDLLDQTIKGYDASGGFTAAKDAGRMNVESGNVGPGSATTVLMFDAHRSMRGRRQRGMLAPPGLNAGLLVSRNDQLIVFEGFPL